MGGTTDAKDVVFKAIKNGKHVITANKALVASYMDELIELLAQNPSVRLGLEAAVCGGIPIIHTIQDSYASDNIKEIAGIMNGTTNFMLSKMDQEGASYDDVLAEAQRLGFAEANPSADVDGFDVQAKIAILAKLAFGKTVIPETVPTQGITKVNTADFQYAAMMKSTVKLLGIAKRLENDRVTVYVSPVVVPESNVIASIHGATNLVRIVSQNLIESSYVGEGAGRFPTANSVMNDIISLGQDRLVHPPFPEAGKPKSENTKAPELTMDANYTSRFYVRMTVKDQNGIIKTVGEHAEAAGVSIYAVLQAPITDPNNVDFVVTTDNTQIANVQKMCEWGEKESFMLNKPLCMPI